MQKLRLSIPKKYTTSQGEEKTKWVSIGTLVIMDDGKVFGDIDAIPTGTWDGSFNAFPIEQQNQNQQQNSGGQQQQGGYQQPQQQQYQQPNQQYQG